MKKLIKQTKNAFIILVVLLSLNSYSQGFDKVDEVPHDIVYYRNSNVAPPLVKVIYGRPFNNGEKEIFGTKIPFNQIWRTGANEATEIILFNDVIFGDKMVNAGTYVLYTIPGEKSWEVILNTNTNVLGAFQYDSSYDVAKITVPVSKAEQLDSFSIGFKRVNAYSINMVLAWGSTRVKVPLDFNYLDYYAGVFE